MLYVAGHQATPSGRLPDHGAKSGLPFPGWPAFLPIWQSSKASITTSSRPFGSSGRLQARKSETRRVQAILAGTAFLPFRALGPVLHSGKLENSHLVAFAWCILSEKYCVMQSQPPSNLSSVRLETLLMKPGVYQIYYYK